LLVAVATFVSPSIARAQEGEPVIVDEVIAQVGDGIVTLSQLKRELRERCKPWCRTARLNSKLPPRWNSASRAHRDPDQRTVASAEGQRARLHAGCGR
jgi:hypothetical protein